MKPELTLELKAKFFAQYFGQDVWRNDTSLFCNSVVNARRFTEGVDDNDYLLLNSISTITDEDLIASYHFFSGSIGYDYTMDFTDTLTMARKWISRDPVRELTKYSLVVDYLRSKGYALPYQYISVTDFVIAGWIKLK